jgi:N-acyl homoserine lactone hydrolase
MTKAPLYALLILGNACFPAIPRQTPDARPASPQTGATLAPCALVHFVGEEDLSNGARGWFRGKWAIAYSSFVIRHPKGVILVDAAFGNSVAADVDQAPFYFRWTFGDARAAKPISVLLAEQGLKPEDVKYVLLTHDHWDHAGGLPDLPNARVIMGKADADWIAQQKDFLVGGAMPHDFTSAIAGNRIDPLTFTGPPTDGFDRSQDVFGDGSIIAVPTPGHTRGATSYFVNSGDGKRWLFIGDAAWVKEGFEEPATKGRLASLAADWNWDLTSDTLGRLHAVYEGHAANIVTSHDQRTWTDVPICGAK